MPQQSIYYPHVQQYCNTSVTTTNTAQYYVPSWGSWSSNAAVIQYELAQQMYTPIITSTGTDQIWQQWVTMGNGTITTSPNSYTYVQETPEEMEARRVQRSQYEKECAAARTRARILLEDFLSEEQKLELVVKGRFHVTGSKGRRYCIRATGQAGNVDLLKSDGQVQATLCCHPRRAPDGYLPDGDAWLMQMIELRHDEDHFLATANVHRGSLPVAA
jgi:hypothetical protein